MIFLGSSAAAAEAGAEAAEAAAVLVSAGLEHPHSMAAAVRAESVENKAKDRLFMVSTFKIGKVTMPKDVKL